MKKLFALFILLTLSVASCAHAELQIPEFQPTAYDLTASPDYEPQSYYPTQDIYVNVSVFYDNLDGSTTERTASVKVGTIMYKYEIDIDDGVYTGARAGGEPYPVITTYYSGAYPVNPVLAKTANPVRRSYNLTDTSYQIIIAGGSFTVSYINVLRYDVENNLIYSASPITETRTFYLNATSP